MSKLRYFAKRTVVTVLLIFATASVLFLLFRSLPGSFENVIAAGGGSPEQMEAAREHYGLNDPLHVQYLYYIRNLVTGDMGNSFQFGSPVLEIVGYRILNSFVLIAPAITLAYLLGSVYGAYMGYKRGTFHEKYGIVWLTMIGTIPSFFLGILLIIVFASWLGFFPTSGMISVATRARIGANPAFYEVYLTADFWLHYTLPFIAIFTRYLYYPALVMRTSIVEVAGQDFNYFHRMKGLSSTTRLRHLMKHASLPIITIFPLSMSRAIGGMILIEYVFNWPGIGLTVVQAVLARDYPIVQFVFFLIAVWVIFSNYFVDILYSVIDPRVTIAGEEGD